MIKIMMGLVYTVQCKRFKYIITNSNELSMHSMNQHNIGNESFCILYCTKLQIDFSL